jgi:5-bromo-4-chloroindolyl phosphate hydrolysis protein
LVELRHIREHIEETRTRIRGLQEQLAREES